ncbi:hypothetical protein DV738_g1122, partial [Chaetothyriales sp. CBS 135597]
MSRRAYGSEVSLDRYVDRDDRAYYRSSGGRERRADDRVYEDEIYTSSRREAPVRDRERERERDVRLRAEVIERDRSAPPPPGFLREDYRRSAGPVVLRKRDVEDFEFAARRRSPSPEPEKRLEKEEIIIRRDQSEPPPQPLPPRRADSVRERQEIIIRRDERDTDPRDETRTTSDDDLRYAPPPLPAAPRWDDRDRQEIIIRREERESDDRLSRSVQPRPVSHERERSRAPRSSESDHEIIIRRDQQEDGSRGREREREEIIVRNHSRSNSSGSAGAGRYAPAGVYYQAPTYPPPTIIAPPPQREDPISRAIDRDYEITLTPRRPVSRPPSPPSPPPERERARSAERIAISRSGEREGREYKEEIVIDRNEVEEEAAYYNDIANQRGYVGESYHGATRDWSLVDVPPGTRRVRMDGAGGGEQEITWQRYNGVRRSKFYPDGTPYDPYLDTRPPPASSALAPAPAPGPSAVAAASAGGIGVSWGKPRDPRNGLWTEITKDLVVKEAIKEMGYEYEETDDFYYVFKYLSYEDMARLVGLSDDIKNARQKRIKEIGWENRVLPEPAPEPVAASSRLLIESGRDRREREHPPWTSDDERYIEREIVYRGGRPAPLPPLAPPGPPGPPGWRR